MQEKITGVVIDIPHLVKLLNECKTTNAPVLILSGEVDQLNLARQFVAHMAAGNAIIMTLAPQ